MHSGARQMAIEACGALYHGGAGMQGLVFFSQTFEDNNNGDGVIGISRSPIARAKTSTMDSARPRGAPPVTTSAIPSATPWTT